MLKAPGYLFAFNRPNKKASGGVSDDAGGAMSGKSGGATNNSRLRRWRLKRRISPWLRWKRLFNLHVWIGIEIAFITSSGRPAEIYAVLKDSSDSSPPALEDFTYCCTTSTENADSNSDVTRRSPIAPSSGHSHQSARPAVSGSMSDTASPGMNLITVKFTPPPADSSTILHANDKASRSSGPPKYSRAMFRADSFDRVDLFHVALHGGLLVEREDDEGRAFIPGDVTYVLGHR
nr:hypothetical protein Iba_chr06aCG5830 [Ipomoea batatas]